MQDKVTQTLYTLSYQVICVKQEAGITDDHRWTIHCFNLGSTSTTAENSVCDLRIQICVKTTKDDSAPLRGRQPCRRTLDQYYVTYTACIDACVAIAKCDADDLQALLTEVLPALTELDLCSLQLPREQCRPSWANRHELQQALLESTRHDACTKRKKKLHLFDALNKAETEAGIKATVSMERARFPYQTRYAELTK